MATRFVQDDDPDEVFGALADEVRIAILQSLRAHPEPAISFSALQAAVDVADSGRFNYHLGKLTDRFIRKTADGYTLTQAGKHIVGAIESGTYTASGEFGPVRLDEPCRVCGERQNLVYHDECVSVECTSCATDYTFDVPPVVFADCDEDDIPRLASEHLRTIVQVQYSGFCTFCNSRITRTVGPVSQFDSLPTLSDDTHDENVPRSESMTVEFDCRQCGLTAFSGVGDALIEHPSVLGFYDDHGVNVREQRYWAFPRDDDLDVTVLDDRPLHLEVTYSYRGESLSVRVDEDLSVLETERGVSN